MTTSTYTTTFTTGKRPTPSSMETDAVKTESSSLLEGRKVVATPSPAQNESTQPAAVKKMVGNSDRYAAQFAKQDEERKKFRARAVDLITMPFISQEKFNASMDVVGFKTNIKTLAYALSDFFPAKLAEKIFDVANNKLKLGYLPLGTTVSLALAATARLVTTVAFATLELAAAAFVAGAALAIGTAVVIASSAALVVIGGTALATSPFSVPIMIYKWTTDLQKTVVTIKNENKDLRTRIAELEQNRSSGKMEEDSDIEESDDDFHDARTYLESTPPVVQVVKKHRSIGFPTKLVRAIVT